MKIDKVSEDRFMTRAEVAELFHVAPSTVTRWAEAGKLPSVKTLGGHHRYETKAVLELARQFIKEEISMEKVAFNVPSMYGDHHVVEVRRLLLEMPGVETVDASSAFQAVEISFDPAKVSADQLQARLQEEGYVESMSTPVEASTAASETNGQQKTFFRHTTAFEQTRNVVSFAQQVVSSDRPLWPCPGMGVIKINKVER